MRVRRVAREVAGFAVAAVLTLSATTDARADENAPATGSRAQDDYSAGRESYRLGLYGRALEEFERSLAQAPSPNTSLYIARTLRELGRWKEAADQYRNTIRDASERGGRYVATREAAEMELGDVNARLDRAENTPAVTKAAPVASPAPAPSPTQAASPSAGTSGKSSYPNTFTWISGGIAVAGAASFAVLYALASDRYAYLEERCMGARDAACESARSTGKTEETVGYVALGVAVVAAAGAIVSLAIPSSNGAVSARRAAPWPLAF